MIGMIAEVVMQSDNIIHQPEREFLNVFSSPLSFYKLPPRFKEILNTDDVFKRMAQLNFHTNTSSKVPPAGILPIIQRFISAYKLWDGLRNHFPKKSRYSLGIKIDNLFLDAIELLFIASYVPREQKLPFLKRASIKLDTLKFFLQVSWELKVLDNAKYAAISEPLNEIGKMLGGWIKGVEKRNPGKAGE